MKKIGDFFQELIESVSGKIQSMQKSRGRKRARGGRQRAYSRSRQKTYRMSNARVQPRRRPAARRKSGLAQVWSSVAAKWNSIFTGKGRLAWFTGRRTAMLAGVLVICIVMPIVVASAVGTGEPEGQGGMTVVDSQVEQLAAGEEQQQDAVPVAADRSAEETTGTAAPEATATPVATAEATATPAATATPTATPAPTEAPLQLKYGDDSEKVAQIQERLMELGYMDYDEPTEHFGSTTRNSVQLFQRKHELDIDGVVGQTTWDLLFSDQAKKYSVSVGITGTDVEELQKRLMELGYISTVTGYYGTDTEAAVKRFQERGLTGRRLHGRADQGNALFRRCEGRRAQLRNRER